MKNWVIVCMHAQIGPVVMITLGHGHAWIHSMQCQVHPLILIAFVSMHAQVNNEMQKH